jgi:hypothetical protein
MTDERRKLVEAYYSALAAYLNDCTDESFNSVRVKIAALRA